MSLQSNSVNGTSLPGSSAATNGKAILRAIAEGLCLAATPTFAIMALLTAFSSGMTDMSGTSMPDTSPLGGMVLMYWLMSLFHLPPWLKLLGSRQSGARHS